MSNAKNPRNRQLDEYLKRTSDAYFGVINNAKSRTIFVRDAGKYQALQSKNARMKEAGPK